MESTSKDLINHITRGDTNMYFSDKVYQILNYCRLIIPAISAFYFTMAKLWNFDHVNEVCGTLAAIAVLLETVLKITTANYNKAMENSDTKTPNHRD